MHFSALCEEQNATSTAAATAARFVEHMMRNKFNLLLLRIYST
jgi:hypothetical protein